MKAEEYFTQRHKGSTQGTKKNPFVPPVLTLCLCVNLLFIASCTHKPAGPLAFVSNERDGTITVIDTSTDRVYSTIKVGGRLRGIRLSPNKQKVWVAISYPSNQSQGEDKIAE